MDLIPHGLDLDNPRHMLALSDAYRDRQGIRLTITLSASDYRDLTATVIAADALAKGGR